MIMKTVAIIDDEGIQAENLVKGLSRVDAFSFIKFQSFSTQMDLLNIQSYGLYEFAIIDIRMDKYDFNGLDIATSLIRLNPNIKIIIISSFTEEYKENNKYKDLLLLSSKNIVDILDKNVNFTVWLSMVQNSIEKHFLPLLNGNNGMNDLLFRNYQAVISNNSLSSYEKGDLFELFITSLFIQIGFSHIERRVIDISKNEIDLILRNDIDNAFFNKFGSHIVIECKNYIDNIGKNEIIIFQSKLNMTKGQNNIGFFVTSSSFNSNFLAQLSRQQDAKSIFLLDNKLILELIYSDNKLETLMKIMDEQVHS